MRYELKIVIVINKFSQYYIDTEKNNNNNA
jgi:hypothetical protein